MLGRECGVEGWSLPVLGKRSTKQAQGSTAEWTAGCPTWGPAEETGAQTATGCGMETWPVWVLESKSEFSQLADVAGWRNFPGKRNIKYGVIKELGLRSTGMADHNSYSLSRGEGKWSWDSFKVTRLSLICILLKGAKKPHGTSGRAHGTAVCGLEDLPVESVNISPIVWWTVTPVSN